MLSHHSGSCSLRVFVVAFALAAALAASLAALTGCGSRQPESQGPLIVLAFDGIATSSLAGDGGRIDGERFPHLAGLASRSTLLTSAVAPSDEPDESFAAVVEGGLCALLDGYESIWDDACGGGRSMGSLGTTGPEAAEGRAARFRRFVDSIRAEPDGRYVVRSSLPDAPWQYLADGTAYNAPLHEIPGRYGEFWGWSPSLVEQGRRRHEEQLRFVDALVGELLDRLDELGLSERATIVVLATRGVSFRPGEKIRRLSEGNADDILRVPLLVHAPGQTRGRVVDEPMPLADLAARLPSWIADAGTVSPDHAERTSETETLRVGGRHHAPFVLGANADSTYRLPEPTPPPGASLAEGNSTTSTTSSAAASQSETEPVTAPDTASGPALGPDTGVFLHGLSPDGALPVMLAGRLHGVPGMPPTLGLEIDGRLVDRVQTYGPRDGDVWFSLLRRPEWRLDEPDSTVRLAFRLGSEGRSVPVPIRSPVTAPPPEEVNPEDSGCGLEGFAERARGFDHQILLTGRVAARRAPADLRIEVYDADRLLYSRSVGASDSAAGNTSPESTVSEDTASEDTAFEDTADSRRFEILLPVALAPRWQSTGLRLAAAGTGCGRVWLTPLYTATLRGMDVDSVASGTGQTARRRPGALAGAVEHVGERWGGVLLAGWAADLDAGRPADRIVVVRGDRVVSDQPLEVLRPDIAAYFRDGALARSGFEFVVEPGVGELRVMAIRGQELSQLPVLRAAGDAATVVPVGATPRLESSLWGETLHLDDHRRADVGGVHLGWVETVRKSADGWIVEGWAGDVKRGEAASRLYVLLDGEVIATAPVAGGRDDVAAATRRPELADSGFRVTLGDDVLPSRWDDLRFVAVSVGGRAGELEKGEGPP